MLSLLPLLPLLPLLGPLHLPAGFRRGSAARQSCVHWNRSSRTGFRSSERGSDGDAAALVQMLEELKVTGGKEVWGGRGSVCRVDWGRKAPSPTPLDVSGLRQFIFCLPPPLFHQAADERSGLQQTLQFSLKLTSGDVLDSVFWSTRAQQKSYELYGDVLSIDATHGTNRVGLRFVDIVGADNENKTTLTTSPRPTRMHSSFGIVSST